MTVEVATMRNILRFKSPLFILVTLALQNVICISNEKAVTSIKSLGNVTAPIGSQATLSCRVQNPEDKAVIMLKQISSSYLILSVGNFKITNDPRINLERNNVNTWSWKIHKLVKKDSGVYQCQIPISLGTKEAAKIWLTVTDD